MTEEEKRRRAALAAGGVGVGESGTERGSADADLYASRAAEGVGPHLLGGSEAERGSADAAAPYRYSLDGDALYQMYRDRYLENARRSMRDTMGQAASLTGGYGSSYSQAVGQQAYDETLRHLTDVIPTLQRDAYERAQRQYANLSASILKSGYAPDEDELAAAGMSREEAEALRQAWITGNPGAAWLQGALTPEQYTLLTGRQAPGTKKTGSAGGGGGRKKSSDVNKLGKSDTSRGEKDRAQTQGAGGGRRLDARA